jgi:hypothetical protein
VALISSNQLTEALPVALSAATADPKLPRVSPYVRMNALLVGGQLGKREHVDRIEPVLDDATVVIAGGAAGKPGGAAGVDVQMRDVALVIMLRLTGQRPIDYGYANAQAQIQASNPLNPAALFPRSAEQRQAAILKWRQWKAAQKSAPAEKGTSEAGARK